MKQHIKDKLKKLLSGGYSKMAGGSQCGAGLSGGCYSCMTCPCKMQPASIGMQYGGAYLPRNYTPEQLEKFRKDLETEKAEKKQMKKESSKQARIDKQKPINERAKEIKRQNPSFTLTEAKCLAKREIFPCDTL